MGVTPSKEEITKDCIRQDGLYKWLQNSRNLRRFVSARNFKASEKRRLVIDWSAAAWKKMCSPALARTIQRAWNITGCAIQLAGEDDSLIQPQGMPGYEVPAPE